MRQNEAAAETAAKTTKLYNSFKAETVSLVDQFSGKSNESDWQKTSFP